MILKNVSLATSLFIPNSTFNTISLVSGGSTLSQVSTVLSHIAPPHLRRKEATTKLLAKICGNDSLPLHADIENHPPARLPSRHPVWLDVPQEELSALDDSVMNG